MFFNGIVQMCQMRCLVSRVPPHSILGVRGKAKIEIVEQGESWQGQTVGFKGDHHMTMMGLWAMKI